MSMLDTLKRDVEAVGVDEINACLEGTIERHIIRLKTVYNVTFEDPSKPPGVGYKRIEFLEGDEFELFAVRKTKSNFIFQFHTANESAEARASRRGTGAGLAKKPTVSEFTMKQMSESRVNANEFLESVLNMVRNHAQTDRWSSSELEIDRGNLWGSW